MSQYKFNEKPIYPDFLSNELYTLGFLLGYSEPAEGFPPNYASNIHKDIAKWQIEASKNNNMLDQNNIRSNWEYRKFVTANANDIIKQNFRDALDETGYYDRNEKNIYQHENTIQGSPFFYKSYIQNDKPLGYVDSDLKRDYLAREQLHSRMIIPSITKDQLMQMQQYK